MRRLHLCLLGLGLTIALAVSPAFSQPWFEEDFLVVEQPSSQGVSFTFLGRSPWLPAPQAGDVSVSYTYQTADEFYFGTTKRPTPGPTSEDWCRKPCGWTEPTAYWTQSPWTCAWDLQRATSRLRAVIQRCAERATVASPMSTSA